MAYDTEYLLSIIEKKAAIPLNQSTFDNSEILEMASDAILEEILPDLLRARQEFLVTYEDLTTTKGSSDNYGWIRVPHRAVGQAVVSVCDPEDDNEIAQEDYWVENNKIFFEEEGTYRVRYHLRPSRLVETSSVATITDINRSTGVITVNARPSSFTTSQEYDFVKKKAGFDILSKDTTSSAFPTITQMTFSSIPDELAVGDYICLADESPVPQLPVDWFQFLASYTAAAILESIGDTAAAQKIESRLARLKSNALSIISPRVQNKSKPIVVR